MIIPCSDSIYNNVEIPIILISNLDGVNLIKEIKAKNDVIISIDIDTPGAPTKIVNG